MCSCLRCWAPEIGDDGSMLARTARIVVATHWMSLEDGEPLRPMSLDPVS
jgi:hypothetical protein